MVTNHPEGTATLRLAVLALIIYLGRTMDERTKNAALWHRVINKIHVLTHVRGTENTQSNSVLILICCKEDSVCELQGARTSGYYIITK